MVPNKQNNNKYQINQKRYFSVPGTPETSSLTVNWGWSTQVSRQLLLSRSGPRKAPNYDAYNKENMATSKTKILHVRKYGSKNIQGYDTTYFDYGDVI